jgi:hypothetical protein
MPTKQTSDSKGKFLAIFELLAFVKLADVDFVACLLFIVLLHAILITLIVAIQQQPTKKKSRLQGQHALICDSRRRPC